MFPEIAKKKINKLQRRHFSRFCFLANTPAPCFFSDQQNNGPLAIGLHKSSQAVSIYSTLSLSLYFSFSLPLPFTFPLLLTSRLRTKPSRQTGRKVSILLMLSSQRSLCEIAKMFIFIYNCVSITIRVRCFSRFSCRAQNNRIIGDRRTIHSKKSLWNALRKKEMIKFKKYGISLKTTSWMNFVIKYGKSFEHASHTGDSQS